MGYIFVSYSRKQLYFAESVVLNLERAGFDVWFDLQKLNPGSDWSSTLADGYSNCNKMVLIASKAAIQSPYVQVEWETALQNGREVIIVVTETLELPVPLQGCAVYDARNRFDHAIQSLIAYLHEEAPAHYDPIPAPGKFPYPLKMPFAIWFTLWVISMNFVLLIIALTHIPAYSLSGLENEPINIGPFSFPAPVGFVYAIPYLISLIPFYNAINSESPIRKFWNHDMRQKELMQARWVMVARQFGACFFFILFTLYPNGELNTSASSIIYLIFLVPLSSLIWALWVPGRSADILRWQAAGTAEQDVREKITNKMVTDLKKQSTQEKIQSEVHLISYALYHNPADAHLATYIIEIFQSAGCQLVSSEQAETHLIIVTNRTSKQWLLDLNTNLSGNIIHILATNINASPELEPIMQTQWVDFRKGRQKTLLALADHLSGNDFGNVAYALQVTPIGFDDSTSFPHSVSLVLGFILLVGGIPLYLILQNLLHINVESFFHGGWVMILLLIPYAIYLSKLIMRRASLPSLFHKVLGYRVAWFASPAQPAKDAIGNQDLYSLSALISGVFDVE